MRGLLLIVLCLQYVLFLTSARGSRIDRADDAEKALTKLLEKLKERSEDKIPSQIRKTKVAKTSWEKFMDLLSSKAWKDEPGCNGEVGLFNQEGELTSPNYPNSYPNDAFCNYLIEAPQGKVVKLEFPEFSIEDQTACAFDFVCMYDGYNKSYEFIGCYCGNLPGLTILSESNAISFYIYSDNVVVGSGFKAVWSFHDAYSPVNNGGGGVICDQSFQAESGLLQTPVQTGSNQYPNNTRCVYSITAPSGKRINLRFEQFCLEQDEFCSHDKVEIYDGESVTSDPLLTQAYCGGNMPPDLTSTGPSLTVVFSSNENKTGSGFTAHWTTATTTSSITPTPSPTPICGVPKVRSSFLRINEGAEVLPHSQPWQIQLLKNGVHQCGGSIIANHWIVTAAHCVFDDPVASLYTVRVGEHSLLTDEGTETNHTVAEIIMQARYHHNIFDSDIAVLRLTSPITYTDNVSPICLPSSDPQVGLLCSTTGWGETGSRPSDVLKGVNVPIISRIDCNKAEMYNGNNTVSMFCAGYPKGNIDTCLADSGGPLVCLDQSGSHMTLYGITSWGNGCAQPNKPGVYTRVSRFTGWIEAKTGVRPS